LSVTVKDVLLALDKITGGRVVTSGEKYVDGSNPFVVTKSSHLPGKAITETPGLVCGNYNRDVEQLGVCMTMSESDIELAGALGLDVLIAHHPIADAANSGGVPLRGYLDLYGISAFELHEAFHGLHPGIAYLHGHEAFRVEVRYGGVPGNIVFVGKTFPEVKVLQDILDRLSKHMGREMEQSLLNEERKTRGTQNIYETSIETAPSILLGKSGAPVDTVLHIFPHTGFRPEHMEQLCKEHSEIDTVVASISRVGQDHELVKKADELGLNFLVGNSHAQEIFENGTPLAKALQVYFPEIKVYLLQERVTATPVSEFGSKAIQEYSEHIVDKYLTGK